MTKYMAVAFGSQIPTAPSGRTPGILAKRDNEIPTHVILVLADSLTETNVSVEIEKRALTDVLADLKLHAPGFTYDYRDENAMLSVVQLPKDEAQRFIMDSMAVYLGTRSEIDGFVKRLSSTGPNVSPVLELAEREADRRGLTLCFVAGFYKPGGLNELGVQYVFAEQPSLDAERARACFYRTFMGAFGLGGRLPDGDGSIFSDNNAGWPTDTDWLLWRLHEDPGLHFGMTNDEARAAVSHLVK